MGKSKYKDNKTSDFDVNKIKYYYGIPHCHSEFSTGKGTPLQLYDYAIKCKLDFLFITDHNIYLNDSVKIKESTVTKWNATNTYALKAKKANDDFLPIVGFECKSSFGDLNIVNSNNFFNGAVKDFRILALWMMNNKDSFISINHPHKNITNLIYNDIYNKLITSIEVCNGNPASRYTRHDKYYYTLLDAGWKLGAINGQDNHRINFNDSENLTVFIGNELTKWALIDAFRNHRTYSTESRFLKLHFLVNNCFMGDTLLMDTDKLKFSIFAEDIKYKIKQIDVLTNGGKVVKSIENINLNNIKYMYEHIPNNTESWYVIKVIEEQGKIALSSPVFISRTEDYDLI